MVDPFDWTQNGNADTNPSNNFVGTTDNQPLAIRTKTAIALVDVDTPDLDAAHHLAVDDGRGESMDVERDCRAGLRPAAELAALQLGHRGMSVSLCALGPCYGFPRISGLRRKSGRRIQWQTGSLPSSIQ